jgi:hypothetical protein
MPAKAHETQFISTYAYIDSHCAHITRWMQHKIGASHSKPLSIVIVAAIKTK